MTPRLRFSASGAGQAATRVPESGPGWGSSLDWETELQRRLRVAQARPQRGSRFVDKVQVSVVAGDGGHGGVSFHREKFNPRGGPSGGNGGQGGSVFLRPSAHVHCLGRIPRKLQAPVGGNGSGQWRNGKAGQDLVVHVPIGTVVRELRSNVSFDPELALDFGSSQPPSAEDLAREDVVVAQRRWAKLFVHYPNSQQTNQASQVLIQLQVDLLREIWETERLRRQSPPLRVDCLEFVNENQTSSSRTTLPHTSSSLSKSHHHSFLVARGGGGGMGNSNFSGNQTMLPRFATRGQKGHRLELELELKSLADVGLVGFPNSGKSTLIHNLTNSRAVIAPYAFTTLNPQIGTLIIYNDGSWDMDDQTSSINHSPPWVHQLDPSSASGFIRDRSARQLHAGQHSRVEALRLTIADCPGLLSKASQNVGLGHAFLRHIERSKILILVVDLLAGLVGSDASPMLPWKKAALEDLERPCREVEVLFRELEAYQPQLGSRVGIVVANKADLSTLSPDLEQLARTRLRLLEDYVRLLENYQERTGLRQGVHAPISVIPVSAKHRQNIKKLVKTLKEVADRQIKNTVCTTSQVSGQKSV